MMSQGMRLTTVAEGVEEPEQADWLVLNQCTLGQGYLWSRPVELGAAHRLLQLGVAPLSAPVPTAPALDVLDGDEDLLAAT